LIKLFQKFAPSRARSPWRAPQSAKSPFAAFFLPSFFFGGMLDPKEKADKHKRKASRGATVSWNCPQTVSKFAPKIY
jgi:hypothetical protein